jgi:hypothetical protein
MQASAQLQFCEDLQENGIAEEASEQQQSGSNAVPPAASEKLLINKNSLWWPQDRLLGSTCGQDPESKQKWRPHYLCLFHHPFRAPYSAVSLYHEQLLLQGFFHLGRSTYK